ncbi:hypothetical protein ACP75B_15460 [Vibrio cholerae]|uniref:Uncharacterized protein n=1 Tax=Vibrio cholerae serotype O1 biovar El Tor TaxID=686 RepID=M1Q7S1_VIBCE|nr:hypothetical protein [Vibrio cholerae]AGG09398.1 hypothetical protein [Vibrio cholerae O1 biovar El Tor]EGQ8257949.1 hypothetical protein [Vibrio cholerae]EGR0460980.1 hypothetical protein [Vibrio cholerae]EGR0472541.1 hypothetical protein [Vibrio cholerae]EGR0514275.1 hypothetical protein [Vibrio cholerae]
MSNVYPVYKSNDNIKASLDNHLDTLLEAAKGSNKALGRINKAYDGIMLQLIKACKGEIELTKGQSDAIKIVLNEQKHLSKVVADLEELLKKVQAVEAGQQPTTTPNTPPKPFDPRQFKSTKF